MAARIPTVVHNGTTTIPQSGYDSVNDNVIGLGTYLVSAAATISFIGYVGAGETIKLTNHTGNFYAASELYISDPADFHGHVDISYTIHPYGAPTNGGGHQESYIAFANLHSHVDSFSYKNDMLKLWSGNKVVEALSLTLHDPYGISVQNWSNLTIASANAVDAHGIAPKAPLLPLHV